MNKKNFLLNRSRYIFREIVICEKIQLKMETNENLSTWIDSYNSSWTREDLSLLLSTGGTQYLFEKLVSNGEIEGSTSSFFFHQRSTKPTRKASRWKIYDSRDAKKPVEILMPKTLSLDGGFHFKKSVDESDFESMISGLLELQIKLGKQMLNKSELVNLIRQKVSVFNRLAHAYRVIHQQRKVKSPQREDPSNSSTAVIPSRGSLISNEVVDRDRVGTQALVELGLTTGLSLVFALLRQNWQQSQQNPGSAILCNEVLKTALRVLTSLPVMSLTNSTPDIGQASLNQVNEFLMSSMNPQNIGNDSEGSILSSEVSLLLATQRGKLSLILQWVHQALTVGQTDPSLKIAADILRLAFKHIRSIGGSDGKVPNDEMIETSTKVELSQAAKLILSELVIQSKSNNGVSNSKLTNGNSGSGLKNDAYLWGSNSSHQLAEGSHEKIISPKKTSAFQEVKKMEAGQYCTFVIQESGHVNAVGKGSYGRLGKLYFYFLIALLAHLSYLPARWRRNRQHTVLARK